MARRKPDQESFPGVLAARTASTSVGSEASPISILAGAIAEHFENLDPHFCQASCAEDLLIRMNERALYIVTEATLTRLHTPCMAEIRWYRDALTSIRDGDSLLKPEIVAKLALDRQSGQ